MTTIRVPTPDEIRAWPVVVDLPTAGQTLGLGRDSAYRAAREGTLPFPVLRLGRCMRVTRAAVMAALGIEELPVAAPSEPHASPRMALVNGPPSDLQSGATAA